MEEELLPPPPKKVVSQNGESDLLPPPPKKKLNEPTSGSVEVSKTVSTPQSVPSSVSGTKGKFIIEPTEANIQELAEKRISDLQGKSSMNDARKYAIDEINKVNSRVTGNITLGDESRQMGIAKGDVFGEIKVNAENAQKALEGINQSRYVRTKKLQEQTVAKQDQVFLEGKKIENLSNQIDFATKLPQYKELTAIDEQLKAMGEPKTKEQIGAYNALIAKRDALLDTDVSQTDEYNATVTIPTFDMPSDDMSEEVNRQNQIKDIVNKGKKSFEAKAAYEGKVKLRDVLGVADMKSKELSSSVAKYKENAAQIDLNIKEMYNLNKDKLEKVGFTKGFFDGINQTTISNTLADLYLSGDDDQLGKSLENLYMEQATMPTETTVGGDIGTMIGGQVKPMAVAFGTSVVSANPAVGVGTGALYYGRMGIGSGLLDVYTTARSQGRTQAEALALAKKQAVAGGVGGVVEGLAGLLTAGGKPVAGIVSNGFKQAVKTGLKEAQIDAVTAGLVAAGQNANIQRLGLDRKLHEGVIENMAGEAFFSVGAKVAITGGQKVRGYGTIVNTMAKGSFRDIQAIVDDAVKQGIANEANASQFIQDVQKSAKAQEKLKGVELNEDVEDDVISLQTKIDELEAQKKNASPATIGELDRQINELSAKLKVEAGFPLTPDERKELNLLQTARDSNKEYDKEKLAELEQRQKNNQDGKTKIVTDQPIRVKYKDGRTGLVFVNAEGDVEFVPDGNSAGLVIDKQAGASFRSLANLGFEQVVGETVAEPNSQLLSGDIAVGTNVLYKGGKYQIASSKNAPDGVKLDADGKVRVVYLKGEDGKVIAVGADSVDGKRIIDDANRVIGKGEATPTETAPVVEAKKKTDETVEVELEAKKADIERRRQEALSQYDEEGLKEAYTVGSNQTIGEKINAEYDAELAALEATTPKVEVQTPTETVTGAEVVTPTAPDGGEGATDGTGKQKTWGKLTKMPHQEGKGVEIDNAPDGNFINVGLQIGQTTELIPEGDVASNLPKDVKILSQTKMVDDFGEPFLSLELSRPLTKAELLKLQEATQQLDIPQLSGKKGTMYGTQQYGLFDPTKMTLPDGTRLSNATTTSSTTKNNFKPNKVLTGANKIISGIADAYKKANRLFSKTPRLVTKVSDVDGKRIADAFNEMKHEPNNPEVKKGFEQLITEIKKQADALIKEGFKFELVTEGKAYNSDSKKMLNDVKNNKRILIEASEGAFGTKRTFDQDNIGLQDSGYTDVNGRKLTNVELIRAVHDLFGHSEYGNGFGAIGEENAWRVHMSMFTPLAQKALTATTRGQNSWVNFGNHMRNADGSIKKKGDAGYLEPNKRPFAEQKIGFLPDWAMENAYGDRVTVNGKEIKPTNKYVVDGKEAYEIDDAQAFFDAISSAKESRGEDGVQVALKTKEEYQKVLDEGGVLLVSKDGKVGVMLEANGNVGSGFAHADLPKGENSLKPLLITAIKLGGRFTDAYDGYLPKYYSRFGFKPSFRMKFNPEFADKGWEKTILKNEPDVVFMYFDGNRETLEADYNKFPDYDNTKGEYVTDYDKAVEATKAKSIELEDQASLTPPPDAKAGATKKETPKTETKVEQATEQVQKFKDVLDQRTDKKADKALKAFGEQAEQAKELIDNYDTNLKKLEEKGVEVKGTKEEILADMLDGKYDEALKSDTSIPSSKTETKTEVPKEKTTETPKTKLQTAKEKLAEAKRKRDELAKKKGNLGAFKDSFGEAEEQAKADRELFDAYVDFAKEYISEVGGTIQDWAKEINEEVDENLKRAWDLANSKGGVKKTVLTTRVYEGDTREEVRKEIEKFGLNRDRIPHAEAEANAKKLIEQVGLDMAYQATINGDIVGGSAAEVYAAKIRDLNEQINSAKTTEEIEILSKDLAAVYSRFSNVATEAGQFGSQLGYIYDRDSDLGYNYEKKIKEYKDANNGEIPAEIAAKFKELDDQIKELSKQIKEAENKAQKASEQQAVDEIKASIKRNPTANKKAKAKRLMSEGLDDIAQALGVQLMASGTKRASVVKGLTKIGQSLILNGEATIENVGEKVREFVKVKFGDKLNFDDFATDFDLAMLPEESDNKLKIPNSYIRGLVEDGIDNIDDLVKAIQKDYSGTEREIRDAITGYGKTFKSGDDIAKEINRMKDIGRMISALEDIEKGQRPLKSGQQREAPTVEQREMRKKVREALKELGVDEATMEKQLKTALDAAKTRLSNQIEDMEAEIAKGEQVPKSARTMRSDKELDDLKAKRDEVKKRYDEMFKDEAYKEAKRLEMTKRATERRIEVLKNKLKNEDFDKKPKKLLIEDTELTKLRAEKIRLQDEYDKEIQKAELRNRTKVEVWKDKAWEAWGITRALSATGEWSFVGVQGLTQLISNPSNSYKAAKTAWSMMWSEKKSDEFLSNLRAQEFYPIMKQSKLAITEPNSKITAREELFNSQWTNIAWGVLGSPLKLKSESAYESWLKANPFKALERASVGYLDTIRVLRFLDGVQMLEMKGKNYNENQQAYKDLADAINTLTGRASLGKTLEGASEELSKVFFSPRNWASGLKTTILLPRQVYKWQKDSGTKEVSVANKIALGDLSKMMGLTTSMVMLAAAGLGSDGDDETSVGSDPTSSDFGKIIIGNRRIDPWGGKIQQIVFASRMVLDSITKGGETKNLGQDAFTPTKFDLITQQATNKLAPSAKLLVNYMMAGENKDGIKKLYGKEYSFKNELGEVMRPIYLNTVIDLLKDDPTALDGMLLFYGFFGGGIGVQEDKKKKDRPRGIVN